MLSDPTYLTMLHYTTGHVPAMAISVVARLGIPELLAEGATTAASLAERTGANEDFLRRVLHYLASEGILARDGDDRYSLTETSNWLRKDVPGSLAPRAAFVGASTHWTAWGNLLAALKSGRSAVEVAFGRNLFEYLASNPTAGREFNAFMKEQTRGSVDAILQAFSFDSTRVLADVGGGHGALVAGVLRAYPDVTGILFDLPEVIATAHEALAAAGVQDRCSTIGGSFFTEVPRGADTYVLKSILHDWGDDQCVSILGNVRRAMKNGSHLLIIDLLRPEEDAPHFANLMDMQMLVMTPGGRERSLSEFQDLLAGADLALARTATTATGQSILECRAA